jgi:protein SCO1/2
MNPETRLVQWGVWGFLTLVVLSVAGVFVSTLLQAKSQPLPVYGQVPEFGLTNQLNQPVSLASLKGDVWVANVIFTRCPGPCLDMTRKMKAVQDGLPPGDAVKLVSLTADPAYDTPVVLHDYATRIQANSKQWQFLTGPKQSVYDLAMNGLKLAVQENASTNLDEMFIHSTRFVVVDRNGRLRAVSFDGTEGRSVDEILKAVNQLLKERGS